LHQQHVRKIARDESLHVIAGKPCVQIVRAAGRMPEQDRDGLALVELRRRLRRRRRHHGTERKRQCSDGRLRINLDVRIKLVLLGFLVSLSDNDDCFVQSLGEFSYASLLLICC